MPYYKIFDKLLMIAYIEEFQKSKVANLNREFDQSEPIR